MDEDACGGQVPEVAGVDLVERGEMRGIGDDRLRFARTCYDHLAGYLGVAIADALVAKGHAILTDDGGEVTASGMNFLSAFGAVLAPKSGSRRIFCRPLPGLERAPLLHCRSRRAEMHRCCLERGWLRRDRDTRIVCITPAGQIDLRRTFGIDLSDGRSRGANARS